MKPVIVFLISLFSITTFASGTHLYCVEDPICADCNTYALSFTFNENFAPQRFNFNDLLNRPYSKGVDVKSTDIVKSEISSDDLGREGIYSEFFIGNPFEPSKITIIQGAYEGKFYLKTMILREFASGRKHIWNLDCISRRR